MQLAKAQSELLGMTKVIREMKGQADILDVNAQHWSAKLPTSRGRVTKSR
jgi:hypothetical protein